MLTKIKRIDAACQPPLQPDGRREFLTLSQGWVNVAAENQARVQGGTGKRCGMPR
jgi:hypothetical protein